MWRTRSKKFNTNSRNIHQNYTVYWIMKSLEDIKWRLWFHVKFTNEWFTKSVKKNEKTFSVHVKVSSRYCTVREPVQFTSEVQQEEALNK